MIDIIKVNLEPSCDNCGKETRYLYEVKQVGVDDPKYFCSECVAELTGPNTGKTITDN